MSGSRKDGKEVFRGKPFRPDVIFPGGDGKDRGRAAAFRAGPGEGRRNSFAGLVTFSRRFFEHRPALRAMGDGKTNDAWLSQTVDAPRPDRPGRLELCVGRRRKGEREKAEKRKAGKLKT